MSVPDAFDGDGGVRSFGGTTSGREMWLWIGLLAVSSGCLAASKWNGLFDFFVVWLCVAARRRAALHQTPGAVRQSVRHAARRDRRRDAASCRAPSTRCATFRSSRSATTSWTWSRCRKRCSTITTISSRRIHMRRRGGSGRFSNVRSRITITTSGPARRRKIRHGVLRCGDPRAAESVHLVGGPADGAAGRHSLPGFERNRGYALLVVAYFLQWLPWIGSPRIAFEYHFFPNLAIIVLCNAIILQKLWNWKYSGISGPWRSPTGQIRYTSMVPPRPGDASGTMPGYFARAGVLIYLAICIWAFFFFFPVLAGTHTPWEVWHARMWIGRWII